MVDIILYEKNKHYPFVCGWLYKYKMSPALHDDLPDNSYLAVQDNEPVAAAGLLKSEGHDAFLMGLITNPTASPLVRSEAIDALTAHIIQKAKYLGFERLLAWTENEGIVERSKKHGFEVLEQQIMIGLDLKGE